MVESDPKDPGEPALMKRLLEQVKEGLSDDEAAVVDRGFSLQQMLEVGLKRFVKRDRENFTAYRLNPHSLGRGRTPTKGNPVRPLPRTRKGRVIEATLADRTETWQEETDKGTVWIRASYWDDLVLEPGCELRRSEVFRCVVIFDPRYRHPLLLVTSLALSARDLRALYLDRWPIEGTPLVAKQLLGAGRAFVSAEKSRFRLPEVSLLAAAILSYLAATEPAIPAGYWDRSPKPTAGRLRRLLATVHFADLPLFHPELRVKKSPTDHLPMGVDAHRRHKSDSNPSHDDFRLAA